MRVRSVGMTAALLAAALLWAGAGLAEAPRGDGAKTGDGATPFTGLASAPEANLFVGAATTQIPIEVPPGRKSMTPRLALTYSSSGGPSAYGYGWNLSLPRIQRSAKHGVLSCTDPTHRYDFALTLPGASVEFTCEPGSTGACRPMVEESFVRIERAGGNVWHVWDKSGLRYVFGGTNAASDDAGATFDLPAREGSRTDVEFMNWPSGGTWWCGYTQMWA